MQLIEVITLESLSWLLLNWSPLIQQKILRTLALASAILASTYTAAQVSASPLKYNALCAASGAFSRCSVEFEENQIIFVSIDGLHEMDICVKNSISYRSNPASPYHKISSSETTFVDTVKRERGIDHDFLIKYQPKNPSDRPKRIVVRFKNRKIAINFAEKFSKSTKYCLQ